MRIFDPINVHKKTNMRVYKILFPSHLELHYTQEIYICLLIPNVILMK